MITEFERGKLNLISKDLYKKALNEVLTDLEEAIKGTLGPAGKTILLYDRYNITSLYGSRDGFNIIKSLWYDNYLYEAIRTSTQDVSNHMNFSVGDATSTGIPIIKKLNDLLQEKIETGIERINAANNVPITSTGVSVSLEEIAISLSKILKRNYIKKLDDLDLETRFKVIKKIATISANNNGKVGNYIAELFKPTLNDLSKHVFIDFNIVNNLETTLSNEVGFEFHSGYIHRSFGNSEDQSRAEYDNPLFLLVDGPVLIKDMPSVDKCIEYAEKNERPLVIIASTFADPVKEHLFQLRAGFRTEIQGGQEYKIKSKPVNIVPINMSTDSVIGRERLIDLEFALGGSILPATESKMPDLTKFNDLSNILGSAEKIVSMANLTRIRGGAGNRDRIKARIEKIQENIESIKVSDSMSTEMNIATLEKRISMLNSNMLVINIGGRSHKEKTFLKQVYEDAVYAVKNTRKKGFTLGGQVSIVRAIESQKHFIIEDVVDTVIKDRKNVIYGTKNADVLRKFLEELLDIIVQAFKTSYKHALMNAFKDEKIVNETFDVLNGLEKVAVYNIMTDVYEGLDESSDLLVAGDTDLELLKIVFSTVSLFINADYMMGLHLKKEK